MIGAVAHIRHFLPESDLSQKKACPTRSWTPPGPRRPSRGTVRMQNSPPKRTDFLTFGHDARGPRPGRAQRPFPTACAPPRPSGRRRAAGWDRPRVGVCRRGLLAAILGGALAGCHDLPADGSRRLRLGHVYEVKSPTHTFGAGPLEGRLREAGVGLSLTVFPAAQLGSESELLEQLVAGEIDLAIAGPSFLAMWHPPLGVFDAAYAFADQEQMLEIAEGPLMRPHWEALRERFGVRVLGTWAYGARHITGNRPIRHPRDLRGFRLRMPAASVWQASGRALGASPMPIAFAEVYMALQQGIADGQENPVPVIHAKGFHEVQQYLSLTGHIQSSVQVLINERVWRSLAEGQRAALGRAIEGLGSEVLAGVRWQERELLDRWRRDGTMRVVEDVDVSAFEAQARRFFGGDFPFRDLYLTITAPGQAPSQVPPAP